MKNGLLKFCALCLSLILILPGCGEVRPAELQIYAMDTIMTLRLWGSGGEEAGTQLEDLFQTLDARFSVTRPDSAISELNRGQAVHLSDQEADLFRRILELSEQTCGALDPCLYPVTKLWGFTTGEYRVPEAGEIQSALTHTGASQMTMTGNIVQLAPGAEADLGAVVKGWSGSLAVEALQAREDVSCALLSLGGNVQTYGQKPDGTPWQIGIQDPAGAETAGILSLTGTWSVVTSGGYQRYFEEGGVRYSHIMDPATGAPADTDLASVTIVARDGLLADGLSTALYIMGLESASEFWRRRSDFEAVFLTRDGAVYVTEGLADQLSGCTFAVIAHD